MNQLKLTHEQCNFLSENLPRKYTDEQADCAVRYVDSFVSQHYVEGEIELTDHELFIIAIRAAEYFRVVPAKLNRERIGWNKTHERQLFDSSFDAFRARHDSALRRYLCNIVGDAVMANVLADEVWHWAGDNLNAAGDNPRSWLFGVAGNFGVRHNRKAS